MRALFRWSWPAVALHAALVVAGCGRSAPTESRPREDIVVPVAARAVQIGSIRTVVHASGVVVPAEGAEFLALAPEPARVLEVFKAEGEAVESGELLVRFELPFASQDLARQQAELAQMQAQMENARIAHARTSDLIERGFLPRVDLDAADRELSDARAAVDRAERALAAAEASSARASVRAPFAGVVAQRLYEPGDLVQFTANPVLRIVDPNRLEVSASVAAADVARVLPGATARLASPLPPQPVLLTVVARPQMAPPGDNRLLPVRLAFMEPTTLAVDTRVELDIDAEERTDVVFVPPEALVQDGAETTVFVAAGDQAERRRVTVGVGDAQRVEITSGLTSGELVITRGQLSLTDGISINVAVEDP